MYFEIGLDRFKTANLIFNEFRNIFMPEDFDISLDDVDEDICISALEHYDISITREDIKNNEKLREILEKVASSANYEAEIVGWLEGYKSAYIEYLNKKFPNFFKDSEMFDYIHDIQVGINSNKKVIEIEYDYDAEDVMDYLSVDENDYYENREDYRKRFEYDAEYEIERAIEEFDKYVGRRFARARKANTREFFDEDASNEEFESSFIEYLGNYLDEIEDALENEDEDNE
jgi:hypothetical protein